MKNQLIDILLNNNVPLKLINADKSISEIVKDIEIMLINRKISVQCCRSLMSDLWKLEAKDINTNRIDSKNSKNDVNLILNQDFFIDGGDFIIYNNKIECQLIQYHNQIYMIDNLMSNQLCVIGYGITQFKIRKHDKINEVYCDGKHPNLNNQSKQFCLDPDFLEMEFSHQNLILIHELLSQFNLDNTYLNKNEVDLIMEIINVRK